MENFDIQKENGMAVSCVSDIPAGPAGIVIALHGFMSSKEAPMYQLLRERFPEKGFGVICPDLPGHGTGASADETLRIPAALDSIAAVERHALLRYPSCEICYFGSSFGAYLIGLYISTREHAGRKAFFRSAAVNMSQLFIREDPTEEEKQMLRDLRSKGYFEMGSEGESVRLTKEMFTDLIFTDLFKMFDPGRFGEHSVAMAHGEVDEVIDPAAAKEFAARFHIPLTLFPGEGHSLFGDPAVPERVIDLAVSLYRGVS